MSSVPNIIYALIFIHAVAWILILTKKDRVVIDLIFGKIRELKSGHQASEYLNRLQFSDEKFSPHEMALLTDLFVSDTNIRVGTWDELADMGVIDENENSKDQAAAPLHPAGDTND